MSLSCIFNEIELRYARISHLGETEKTDDVGEVAVVRDRRVRRVLTLAVGLRYVWIATLLKQRSHLSTTMSSVFFKVHAVGFFFSRLLLFNGISLRHSLSSRCL